MDWQAIARIEQRLQQMVAKLVGSLFEFSLLATTSKMGDQDSAQTEDKNTDDARPARRLEGWGFRGRPKVKGVRGLILRIAGGDSGFLIGLVTDTRWGKVDLDDGEVVMYSGANPAMVWGAKNGLTKVTGSDDQGALKNSLAFNQDGSITMKANDGSNTEATFNFDANGQLLVTTPNGHDIVFASGGNINLNGSAKGVARFEHKVGNGTLTFTLTDPAGTTSNSGSPISFSTAGKLEVKYSPGDGSADQDHTAKGDGSATAQITVKEKIVEGSASVLIKAD